MEFSSVHVLNILVCYAMLVQQCLHSSSSYCKR